MRLYIGRLSSNECYCFLQKFVKTLQALLIVKTIVRDRSPWSDALEFALSVSGNHVIGANESGCPLKKYLKNMQYLYYSMYSVNGFWSAFRRICTSYFIRSRTPIIPNPLSLQLCSQSSWKCAREDVWFCLLLGYNRGAFDSGCSHAAIEIIL